MELFFTLLETNIYFDFLFDFLINIITVTLLCYAIYYKRYKDKEAATSYMLFNIFVFIVITVLFNASENLSLGLGFGLFAILSIIRLRSDVMTKLEITYFFGALALGIINAIGLTNYPLLVLCNVVIVAAAYILDNQNMLRGVYGMKVTLDYIPEGLLGESDRLNEELSKKFGVEVISYSVRTIDYVKDTARLKITYHIA